MTDVTIKFWDHDYAKTREFTGAGPVRIDADGTLWLGDVAVASYDHDGRRWHTDDLGYYREVLITPADLSCSPGAKPPERCTNSDCSWCGNEPV